jgi:hypothetical protein
MQNPSFPSSNNAISNSNSLHGTFYNNRFVKNKTINIYYNDDSPCKSNSSKISKRDVDHKKTDDTGCNPKKRDTNPATTTSTTTKPHNPRNKSDVTSTTGKNSIVTIGNHNNVTVGYDQNVTSGTATSPKEHPGPCSS